MVAQPADSGRPACKRSLTGRRLALTGLQHAAHEDFFDQVGVNAGASNSGLDRFRTEIGGGQAGSALKGTHGSAGGGYDDDRVIHAVFSLRFIVGW